MENYSTLKKEGGNSLAVQWLGVSTFTAGAQVQSLVGELRFPQAPGHGQKKKKKEILPFATSWMNLEGIMLSEISYTEKDKHYGHLYVE